MEITRGKLLAIAVATAEVVLAIVIWGWNVTAVYGLSLALLVPLSLIWFPDVIGSARGAIGHGAVDKETPEFLVSFVGWLILVGAPLAAYFLK